MIELFITVHSLGKFKKGGEVFAYSSRERFGETTNRTIVKILMPFEAVEHLGNGKFRLLIKGLEY